MVVGERVRRVDAHHERAGVWLEPRVGVGAYDERRLVGVGEHVAGQVSVGGTRQGVSPRRADHEERRGLGGEVVHDCRGDVAGSERRTGWRESVVAVGEMVGAEVGLLVVVRCHGEQFPVADCGSQRRGDRDRGGALAAGVHGDDDAFVLWRGAHVITV